MADKENGSKSKESGLFPEDAHLILPKGLAGFVQENWHSLKAGIVGSGSIAITSIVGGALLNSISPGAVPIISAIAGIRAVGLSYRNSMLNAAEEEGRTPMREILLPLPGELVFGKAVDGLAAKLKTNVISGVAGSVAFYGGNALLAGFGLTNPALFAGLVAGTLVALGNYQYNRNINAGEKLAAA